MEENFASGKVMGAIHVVFWNLYWRLFKIRVVINQ